MHSTSVGNKKGKGVRVVEGVAVCMYCSQASDVGETHSFVPGSVQIPSDYTIA